MVGLWADTCLELGGQKFDEAFRHVLKTSTFRPDIAEIRKAAGLDDTDPTEKAALLALQNLLKLIRDYGPKLRRKSPYPELDARTESTLLALGSGMRDLGLELVATHPNVTTDAVEGNYRLRTINEIEKKWINAWRQG